MALKPIGLSADKKRLSTACLAFCEKLLLHSVDCGSDWTYLLAIAIRTPDVEEEAMRFLRDASNRHHVGHCF